MGESNISKELEDRMLILETQVSQLKEMVLSLAAGKQPVQRREVDDEEQVYDALRGLTAQRHATLQMLLDDATQAEMAERFQITEEAVKGRMMELRRALSKELNAKISSTKVAVNKYRQVLDGMSDERYIKIAGISRDWHENWKEEDREINPRLYK